MRSSRSDHGVRMDGLRSAVGRLTMQNLFSQRLPSLPWQQPPYAAVFERPKPMATPKLEQCFVGLRDVAFEQPASRLDSSVATVPKWVSTYAAKRRRIVAQAVSPDDLRVRSLLLVKLMVLKDPSTTILGEQMELCRINGNFERMWSTLEDTFQMKATGTLYKRVRSIWAYFNWCRCSSGVSSLSVSDDQVYSYLCVARRQGVGASHGNSLMQAFNFFHATCGIKNYRIGLLTNRCKGVAADMFKGKKPLEQARPMYVDELRFLEQFVVTVGHPDHVRLIAGYLLFCALACCRFSDPMFSQEWIVSTVGDFSIIETATRYHKTAGSGERSAVLLPFIALGRAFAELSWARVWNDLRLRLLGDASKFSLPAWSEQSGQFLARPMTAAEGTMWLRDIVVKGYGSGSTLTTHSLKCTLLAWATRAGVMSYDQRRVLGHHMDPHNRSPSTYGRDNLAAVIVLVGQMLHQIKSNAFNPDDSRVVFIDRELTKLLGEVQQSDDELEHFDFPEAAEEIENHEEAMELETAEDVDIAADDHLDGDAYISSDKSYGALKQHEASGILHIISSEDRFVCGRKISPSYIDLRAGVSLQWPLCRQCSTAAGPDFLEDLES